MKVTYQILLDDSTEARTRTFYREAGEWPFPNLPTPGDAVTIDDASYGRWPMQTRAVHRVAYNPREGVAHILFRVTGLDDLQPQIDILAKSGFQEITGDGSDG
jgi:hypothetical protein